MKYENEVTVEIDISKEDLFNILKKQKFVVKEIYDVKDIYMLNKREKNNNDTLELLKNCILIRNIIDVNGESKKITYKYKEYNNKKEIVKQGKINCKIDSIKSAKELFEAIGYEEFVTINDHITVFSNSLDELCVQEVNNKHIYIEIEDDCHYTDKQYLDINEMKNVFKKYNIPIINNNYFVKKAEVEIKEKYNI